MSVRKNFYNLIFFSILLFIILITTYVYATDYTISDGTTQTTRVTLTDSDTLTIDSGGTLDYYWPAVDADNRTFSSSTTEVTNNGTITGAGYLVDFRSSTNAKLVNNGTMTATSSSRALYINNSANTTITNNGTIQISSSSAYEAIDGDSTTDLTIINASGATISSAGDDAIAIASAEDVTITNAGTISAADDNIIDADGIDGLTLTNSGTMSATDDFGLYMRNASGTITINNSGTISSAIYPMYYTGNATLNLTNSGTITLTDGLPYDTLALQANATVTNTGTISGGRYALTFNGTGIDVVNKGTVTGLTYDFMSSTDGNLANLTNGQGGNDCVNWYGYLPTNYKIYIASTSSYGKMCNDESTWYMWGDTNFSIDTDSTLQAGTYTDVFKWTAASDFASGTTGTCSCANGSFNWTLSDTNNDTHWDLIITSNDNTAPTLSSSTPADNATGVAINANIVLNFDEEVDAESGNVTIKKTSDNSTVETIDVTGAKVSGSGGTAITINPANNFDSETQYYILVDASAFDDAAGNSYAGISSTTALSFTSSDITNPSLSSSSPTNNETDVSITTNIVLTFDDEVDAESGNVTIKKTSDNSTVETIDVTGAKVSGSGGTAITINPSNDLVNGTEYYILIDASAFDDAAGNSYAGISSTTSLSFTTIFAKPFEDKTILSSLDVQNKNSEQIMEDSIKSVIDRMDLIRKMDSNISVQGIQVAMNFDDKYINELYQVLSKTIIDPNISTDTKKWALWTEGNISYGQIGEKESSLGQKIHSDGITIGIDRKFTNNKMLGFSINRVWQQTDIGNNAATIDTDAYSINSYGSIEIKKSSYVDAVFGYSQMDIDFVRDVLGSENTGNRDGQQIYTSVAYSVIANLDEEDLDNSVEKKLYSRLDLGYTILDGYTESGSSNSTLNFNDHYLKNVSLSFGTVLNKIYEIDNGTIKSFLRFEFGGSRMKNSLTEAYYTSNTSQLYTHQISDKLRVNTRFGSGIVINKDSNKIISIVYDRTDGSDKSFQNSINLNIKYLF